MGENNLMHDDHGSLRYLLLACLVAAMGGLLFGFDTAVISGAIDQLEVQFALSALMKGWIVSSALVGCLIGSAIAGALSDRFGRKKVLLLSAVLFTICSIGSALPQAPWHLVAARLIGGTGIGIASMLSPLYIAEISPARLRGGLISVYQLAITIGVVMAYFSNYGLAELARHCPECYGAGVWRLVFVSELWRGMLLAGLLPAGILFGLVLFVPESPRWLCKQGRTAEGLDILTRVNGREAARKELAEIEGAIAQESGSVKQLFRRGMRLALLIGIVLPFFSQISGINVIIYYGPTVLKNIGLENNAALYWQILFGSTAALATVVAMLTVDKWGRKPPLLGGIAGVGAMLALSGILLAMKNVSPIWLVVVFAIDVACFNLSYGPICWVIVSEIFPTAIRGRAMSISIFSLWIGCTLVAQTFPLLWVHLGPTMTFWLYGLTTPVAFLFVLFLVPETKGKSLEQIERQWTH
jgi:SP family arabinose:H+ symporter-like MFS transporter